MRGITLIAIGNRSYLDWAINLAVTIRYYSPAVKIQLIVNRELADDAKVSGVFDIFTVINKADYTSEAGDHFPAKLKLSLYNYLYFDETLYFDVDACLLKDVTPLFNCEADIAGDIQGVYDKTQGEGFNGLKWATPKVIWQFYDLAEDARLPAINSSFMFIRKGETAKKIFEQAYNNLMTSPIPVELHWHRWIRVRPGKVTQPDELYFDIALAQLGYVPKHEVAVYFRMINEGGMYIPVDEVRKKHYAVGLFGDLRTNHLSCREMYDKEMQRIWPSVMGSQFWNKAHLLGKGKFVNT